MAEAYGYRVPQVIAHKLTTVVSARKSRPVAGRSEAMSRKSSVHEISPRLATKGRAREVRYPIPFPPPSEEVYAQTVKDGAAMLYGLSRDLEGYNPGGGYAGAHLVAEARSRIETAAKLLSAIASENGKGGAGLHRLFMRHLTDGERRHREHIRTDVHNMLSDIRQAIEARMDAEANGTWKPGKGDLLRMLRNANERMAG